MSDRSKIEWTDASWNPIRVHARGYGGKAANIGWHCEHVSEGCRNCYAEAMNRRLGNGFEFKPGNRGALDIFLDETMLLQPLKWKKPRRIFVCSMTDLFADFVTDEQIDRVFAVMAVCGQHMFQVLTKRAARMRAYMGACFDRVERERWRVAGPLPALERRWPLPNVWLGVSCEDQQRADERLPDLLQASAAIRFVSLEPLLGPINLREWLTGREEHGVDMSREVGSRVGACTGYRPPLDWVIVGGESGPGARPMHPDWPRAIRDRCAAADVPFFFKQWGEHAPYDRGRFAAERVDEPIQKFGKRAADRLLDGVEHNGMPEATE